MQPPTRQNLGGRLLNGRFDRKTPLTADRKDGNKQMSFSEQQYFSYMSSPQWAEKKRQRMAIDGGRCQMCGTTENLQIHHFGYKNFTTENPWVDLVTVCENCHKNIHVLMNRPTGRNEDGSMRHGWKNAIPHGIVTALEARGLM